MYYLKTRESFDSAHFLAGYAGKCANLHGHRWTLEVEIGGVQLTKSGSKRDMLLDFGDFKKVVRALADSYDHKLIYEEGSLKLATVAALQEEGFQMVVLPFRPTAENLAKHFYDLLKECGLDLYAVTVYETPENCAVYKEET